MDSEHIQEEQKIILTPAEVEAAPEVPEVDASAKADAAPEGAPAANIQEHVEAETVHIAQGGAQNVKAEKVFVEQGGIARAEARFIDVHEGGIAVAQGENITISEGGAAIVAAEHVKMEDSVALFVAASQIEGKDTMVLFDVRAAVVFALVLGLVTSISRLIMGRKR